MSFDSYVPIKAQKHHLKDNLYCETTKLKAEK